MLDFFSNNGKRSAIFRPPVSEIGRLFPMPAVRKLSNKDFVIQGWKWFFSPNGQLLNSEVIEQNATPLQDVVTINATHGYKLILINSNPLLLMLMQTDLTKPEFSSSSNIYQLNAINNHDVTFVEYYVKTNQNANQVSSPVYQLNGHIITSAVLIPKEKSNALFRKGSFVLFAGKWFIEVSDTFNDLRPFVVKDITELICLRETVAPHDMKTPFTTTHMTPEQPKSETKDPKLESKTKDPDATKSNSQTIMIIILVTSIIIFFILIIIYWSCQSKNKGIVKNNSNRKGKILSEEASDVKTSESGVFDAQSDADYSKPILALSNASPTTDASMTELGKPTDLFVNNNTMRSE